MNKKIKIIELFQKMSNGEEMPKNIRVFYGPVHDDYKYDKNIEWYVTLDESTTLDVIGKLNNEVEILEDNTEDNTEEIEEIKAWRLAANYKDYESTNDTLTSFGNKLNEIIKYINKLRKDIEK